jgi:hypothetical protein
MYPSRLASARSIAVSVYLVNMMLMVCAQRAAAHPEFNPITTNRYLKIDLLSSGELRLAYTVMYGDAPAAVARKEADSDANGRIDDSESARLGERLQSQVQAGLSLTIDGKPWAPTFEKPVIGLMGQEVAPSPFSVDLVARVPCPGAGPHEVRLDDRLELGALGETEIRIEESPSTRLLSSFRGVRAEGSAGAGREPKFVFRGPRRTSLEDRSITFRFEGGAAAVGLMPIPLWRRYALAVGGLTVLVAVVVLGLRYRRMKG